MTDRPDSPEYMLETSRVWSPEASDDSRWGDITTKAAIIFLVVGTVAAVWWLL